MKQNQFSKWMNVRPVVGSFIKTDWWNSRLMDCDDWDQADFRLEGTIVQVAVNVEVTGRTLQFPFGTQGGAWVRAMVTFVGDCEPDQHQRGWMMVDDNNRKF